MTDEPRRRNALENSDDARAHPLWFDFSNHYTAHWVRPPGADFETWRHEWSMFLAGAQAAARAVANLAVKTAADDTTYLPT